MLVSRAVGVAALALAVVLAGCVTSPEYKDPLAALQAPAAAREGPLAGYSVRVIFSENTQKALSHIDGTAQMYRAWGQSPPTDSRGFTDQIKQILERRFRNVAFLGGEPTASTPRADLTMVFDARVTIGQMSFTQNVVELAAIFTDENRQPLETVTGKGTSTVPWPAMIPSFPAAQQEAFDQLGKNLDGATKLRDLIASRVTGRPAVARPSGPSGPGAVRAHVRGLAGKSFAVVIGINKYRHAEPLNYAVNDARSVAALLPELGFTEVRVLLDDQATKAEIERIVYADLKEQMGADDRLFVFFAGHGTTVKLPRGGEEGFLIPVDGEPDRPELTAIAMDEVKKMGRRVPAKHIFFAIDSCFSGFALTRAAPSESVSDADLLSALEEPVVQVITAGRKGQKAVETEGHGLFTKRLLDGLRGLADRDRRGFVTVSQLAAWLSPRVTRDSAGLQHPQYSALEGEGDFVFVLPERPAGR